MQDLVSGRVVLHPVGHADGPRNPACELRHAGGLIRPDVEDLADGSGNGWTNRYIWGNVIDVAEGTGLLPGPENRHGAVLHRTVHEDSDHVAIAVPNVLGRPEDIVRTENDIGQAKDAVRGPQVLLYRQLGDSIGVFGTSVHVFAHRRRTRAISSNRRCEDEALRLVVHGGVNQVDTSDHIIRIIETFNEVAQILGGVGREMIDDSKTVLCRRAR